MSSIRFKGFHLLLALILVIPWINATPSTKTVSYLSKMKYFGKMAKYFTGSKPGFIIDKYLQTVSCFSNIEINAQLNANFAGNFDMIKSKWEKNSVNINCFRAPKRPLDRRRDTRKLRIMSYNAEWLFLFGGTGSVQCPGLGCPWDNLSKAREHIRQTIELLVKIDADIVHFNEVEDCRVLRLIMDMLPSGHGYRAYLVPGTDNMTGQNVGVLTRIDPSSDLRRSDLRKVYPVPGSTCGVSASYISYSNGKKRSGTMGLSKHYLTYFQVGDKKIMWAGAHFIAHPSSVDRCVRREAQAAVLADFITSEAHTKNFEVIVTGDLNDHDEEVLGSNKIAPLSSVLRILKSCKPGLRSAMSFVNDTLSRYSSWHDINFNCVDDGPREHSLIDHVLISPGLARHVSSVWIDHNSTVSCKRRISDHWPIIVDFSF